MTDIEKEALRNRLDSMKCGQMIKVVAKAGVTLRFHHLIGSHYVLPCDTEIEIDKKAYLESKLFVPAGQRLESMFAPINPEELER